MSMYFYDETDDWPEYQVVRDHIQHLEKEHLECRREIQEGSARYSIGYGERRFEGQDRRFKKEP